MRELEKNYNSSKKNKKKKIDTVLATETNVAIESFESNEKC